MFKRCLTLIVASVALMVCVGLLQSYAADNPKAQRLEKATTNAVYRWFTINNIFNWYNNNGRGSYNKITSNSGFEYPKGGGIQCIFEDGVVWGGMSKGVLKVGGSTYNQGLQAGAIQTPGGPTEPERAVAYDPTAAKYRVYRARPDVRPNTPFDAVKSKLEDESSLISRYESFSAQTLYNMYIQDWNEWPGFGSTAEPNGCAPFTDVNGDGRYDPSVDIPGQPGADQTLYYVANDLNAASVAGLSGSLPIGLEMHRTVWGYNLTGALGSCIFESSLIINKSGAPLDSAFFVQWSDPDDGVAEDDYAGCDVGRSVGYVYNGKPIDGKYGAATPAAGYDFFQGPIIPGLSTDRAVFRLSYRYGFKNLGMTTFVFFINSNATYTDPNLGANGDIQWYRLMNGHVSSSDAAFTNPITNQPTKFCFDGDPVTGQGWLDGTFGFIPGDRRLCLITGPFTLANGDTQELVVGKVAGQGADRISSVNVMKWYDDLAQGAYDNLFAIPRPPPTPKVVIDSLDQEIMLSWADSVGSVKIESFVDAGYAFEGYNVYQFRSSVADLHQAVRLATYDKVDAITTIFDNVYDAGTGYVIQKPVQFGSDIGLKRYFQVTTDAVNTRPLVNGTPYYFGVTSYAFNGSPTANPKGLESAPDLLTIVPQSKAPGGHYALSVTDTVKAVQTVAAGGAFSEGVVMPIILDPKKTTGHQYRVTFRDESGTTVWDLFDVTANKYLIRGNPNQSGDEDYPIVDGMIVKVTGPPAPGMKDYQIPSGERRFTWSGASGYQLEGFNGAMGWGQGFWGGNTGPADLRNVLLKLAPATKAGVFSPSNANVSYAYRFMRGCQSPAAKPEFAPYIIHTGTSYDFQDYVPGVPFSAWNVETTPPTRLAIMFLENNVANGLVDGKWWAPLAGVDNWNPTGAREWFFILNAPYTGATPDPAFETNLNTGSDDMPLMWVSLADRRADVDWVDGDQFLILANHVNTAANTFTFTSPTPLAIDQALAKVDVDRVNVFPNPYIGYSTLETDKYNRFVQFSHLPNTATIRIFNLAGILVKTLQKVGGDQFFKWNLRNEQGFPIASGMYIVYIDMPDQGKTKVLKLGVVMEQQFIDRW